MTCDDYLAMLATLPVDELDYGRAREHAAGCGDCDRVTRVVAQRERNLRLAFGDLHSSVPAAQVAEGALDRANRRRVARYYQIGLGITGALTALYMLVMARAAPEEPAARVSETFQLQCLSADQAADLLRPVVQATGSIAYRASSSRAVLEVDASPAEMARARMVIDHYDNSARSQCARQ